MRQLWQKIGPGLVTGASDDDPSGIAIYSQVGASSGFQLLWTALLTFPLMAAVQEMCARIGLVTGHGLAGNLRQNYPRAIMLGLAFLVVAGNTLNIGADLAGMAATAHLIIPVPAALLSIIFAAGIIGILIFSSYKSLARFLKWTALTLVVYLFVPFVVHTDWSAALKATIVPSLSFNHETLLLIIAVLGTTISPYLFFWQTSMEVENKASQKSGALVKWVVTKHELRDMKEDVTGGMLFSNIVMWFIIVAAAVTLFPHGIRDIGTVNEAAEALRPIAGNFAYILFAVGVLSVGFLAIPVLAGSSAYALSETFGWREGLNKAFHRAEPFYLVIIASTIIGLAIPLLGIDPVKALFYTGVFYGITSPLLIFAILHIANNKQIMGNYANSRMTNILGYLALILMTAAVLGLFIS